MNEAPASPSADRPRLLHVFSTFVAGGPQVRAAQLMSALADEFAHVVIAMDGRTGARELVAPEVALELLERPPAPPRSGSLGVVRALRRTLRAVAPRAVLTYNWGAIEAVLAARTLGLSVLHHEDGFLPDETERFKRRRVWARRLLLPGARRVLVPSRNLERIARERWRLAPERVVHVPNGIHVERFAPADGNPSLRAELGIPERALVVGSVGHLRAEKNPGRLLDAAARLVPELDLHLLVLGDGEERAALERRAAAPPLVGRVHLAGHRRELPPWYRAMDAFAMSSDTEQMPIALVEAMASGLAVVSTDVGDVRSMLPEPQGPFVVPLAGEATVAALAEALRRLALDAELRATLGRANRERVHARFTFERMVAEHRARWLEVTAPPTA